MTNNIVYCRCTWVVHGGIQRMHRQPRRFLFPAIFWGTTVPLRRLPQFKRFQHVIFPALALYGRQGKLQDC